MKFNPQKWMLITGIPACIGVVVLFSRTIVTFADMPKRVDTIEQYIQAQQKANEIQAEANAMFQQQIQKQTQKQPYCEMDEGILWCWDERDQTWYQVNP